MVDVRKALEDAQRLHLEREARRACPGCGQRHGGGEHWTAAAAAEALTEAWRARNG